MKLTHKSEYALLALALLARNYPNGVLSADHISEAQKIPKRFLQQILFTLKRGGYVRAIKGAVGGYSLTKSPGEVTLAEIIRFFEGPLAATTSVSKNFYHPSPIESEEGMLKVFAKVRDVVSDMLEGITLEEASRGIVNKKSPKAVKKSK